MRTTSYYEDIKKLDACHLTDRQIIVGRVFFWIIIALNILLILHIAFTVKEDMVYLFVLFYILMFPMLLSLPVFYSRVHYIPCWEDKLDIPCWEDRLNVTNIHSIHSFVYAILFFWNFLRKYDRIRMMLVIITYVVFFLPIFMAFLYELAGWYIDISHYISILDIMPNVWEYSGGNMADNPLYALVNTMYVIIFYGICLISLLYFVLSGYGIYVWKNNLHSLLSNPKTATIIQAYLKNHPEKKRREYRTQYIYALLGSICFFIFGFYVGFYENYVFMYYEFSFGNGIYNIIHTLFYMTFGVFCGLIIPLCIKVFIESKIYDEFLLNLRR